MAATMPSTYKIILQTGSSGSRMRATQQSSLSKNVPNRLNTPDRKKLLTGINRNKMMLFKTAGTLLSRVGDYTGNRIAQKNISNALRWANIGITSVVNPAIGITMAVTEVAGNVLDYGIQAQRSRIGATVARRLSGNTDASGSRYGGKMR
jgi:hypothetical protein